MDWRTTIPGLVGGLAYMARALGLQVPDEVISGVIAICFWLLGTWASSGRTTK